MYSMLFYQRQFLFVLARYRHLATTQCQYLRRQLAHFSVAQHNDAVGGLDMNLLEHLEVSGQRLDKDRLLIAHALRYQVQVPGWQRQVLSERSVTIDDAQCAAVGAMCRHVLLAIKTISTVAGGIDFANHALADQGGERGGTGAFVHRLDHTNKFMPQHTPKAHIATHDLQVGIANSCQQDTYQGFSIFRGRL